MEPTEFDKPEVCYQCMYIDCICAECGVGKCGRTKKLVRTDEEIPAWCPGGKKLTKDMEEAKKKMIADDRVRAGDNVAVKMGDGYVFARVLSTEREPYFDFDPPSEIVEGIKENKIRCIIIT